MEFACFDCRAAIVADDEEVLGEVFLDHARSEHEWPYRDQSIRNFAAAMVRLTGPAERLEEVGEIEIHPVTVDRLDDWVAFFDHDAFVGTPEWAACYCLEPHVVYEGKAPDDYHWRDHRSQMIDRLRDGGAFGYLAYVDGRPAGWVNASSRSDYTLFEGVDGPEAASVIGVSCFIVAPPYRRHGVAGALLDRVVADASERGAVWVEGYPFNPELDRPVSFRGSFPLFEQRGFEQTEVRERYTVMRRPV